MPSFCLGLWCFVALLLCTEGVVPVEPRDGGLFPTGFLEKQPLSGNSAASNVSHTNTLGATATHSAIGGADSSSEHPAHEGGLEVHLKPNLTASTLPGMIAESAVLRFHLFSIVSLILCVIFFELVHLRFSGVDFREPFVAYEQRALEHETGEVGAMASTLEWWRDFIQHNWTYFMVTLGVCATMLAYIQYLHLVLLGWSNDFWARVQKWGASDKPADPHMFYSLIALHILYALALTLSDAYLDYILSIFRLDVWGYMVEHFTGRWLNGSAFYRMEMGSVTDNPDQRIEKDTWIFVTESSALAVGLVHNTVQGVIFGVQVWDLSPSHIPIIGVSFPGWMLYATLLYSALVTVVVHMLSWRLKILDATSQAVDADMRFELMSVRHNAEVIAMNRSARTHHLRIQDRFKSVRRSVWEKLFVHKRYSLASSFLSQTEGAMAFLFIGPSFLNGESTLGQLMAAHKAYALFRASALWFAHAYGGIQMWRATTERLQCFDASIQKHSALDSIVVKENSAKLSVSEITVWLPQDAATPTGLTSEGSKGLLVKRAADEIEGLILQPFSFTAPSPSLRLLLQGDCGSGKSTLLKALAGIWPNAGGTLEMPGKLSDAFFFPTQVCVPSGSLEAALAYPAPPGHVDVRRMQHVLELVGLSGLAVNGLDVVAKWEGVLSAGQKARLNLARVILHRPILAGLDEPTAHIEVDARVDLLCTVLEALPPSCNVIVVTHEHSQRLAELFNMRFKLDSQAQTLVRL